MSQAQPTNPSSSPTSTLPTPSWRALRFFNAYRLTLAALLMGLHTFAIDLESLELPRADPFILITAAYGLAAFVLLTLDELRLGGYALRLQLGLFIDILALGLLGHVSNAAHDNLHILMVANIAYASMLLGGREALAFAAIASVWLLILASWQAGREGRTDMLFTHAGVMGITLFAVAILARTLARRLEASQRLAEQRGIDLANETQLNRLILERTEEGVLIVDGEDRARHANRAARRLLRCDPSPPVTLHGSTPWIDTPVRKKSLAEIHPELDEAVKAWRQQPEDTFASFRLEHPERLQVRIAPLDATPHGPLALFLEDHAHLMEQLQQAKLAALGRLTASIAHEIRNPLSAIHQASQLLSENNNDDQQRQLLAIIHKQVERIDRIVENVLTTSRRKQAHPERLNLTPWLKTFVSDYRRLQGVSPEELRLEVEHELNVRVDPGHLEQMLTILLDNALQHGRSIEGPTLVKVRATLHGPRQLPALEVMDQGPGVAPEVREHLFEPFFTTSTHGHGLGLFVARELAEANQLGLQYHPGTQGGSLFRITFLRLEFKE